MKKRLSLLLALALTASVFTGCKKSIDNSGYVPTGDAILLEGMDPEDILPPEENTQELCLAYYPSRSMNPLFGSDFTNRALFSLIYQSLFVTDRNYESHPILCSRYVMSRDMKTYTFYIDENATFSDGTKLTIQDVEASLKAAEDSRIYGGRFSKILRMYISEDGGITMELSTAYENLPILLDIPIIKRTQLEVDRPVGTGPYTLDATSKGACLRRRTDWWCSAEMIVTAPTIALLDAQSTTQIRDAFQFSDLSLVCADPGSDSYADYRCDYELWDCENGIFLYLACCQASEVFSIPEVRTALTYAIDRETLAEDYYRGFARPVTLPASPLSPHYSEALAERYQYNAVKFAQVIQEKGLQGSTVTFLVNKDDSLRLRVARDIAQMLTDCGLVVQMSELSGNNYTYALQAWNFDIYLGQTRLSANMDLTAFFHSNGAVSWGGVNNATAYNLCLQSLENHGNYYSLHKTVMDNGLLCPVLIRSYAVYATRGLLTGLTPSRDNVFYYSLGKNMEQALIRE